MHNLYCLAPDIKETVIVVNELIELGVRFDQITVAANDNDMVVQAELTPAEINKTIDVVCALKRGVLNGGLIGVLAGATFVFATPPFTVAGFSVVALAGVLGASLGAWASVIISLSFHESDFERYTFAIKEGSILIIVKFPYQNALLTTVAENLRINHPNVLVEQGSS